MNSQLLPKLRCLSYAAVHSSKCMGRVKLKRFLDNSRQSLRLGSSASRTFSFQPDDINSTGDIPAVFDIVVVGGGIVGITTARALLIEKPNLKIAVLEKEADVAVHQSGRNSGVIHAGIYYKPKTLKSKLCLAGLKSTYAFCDKHDIPYKKCGKLIVATNGREVSTLKRIYKNALTIGAPDVQLVDEKTIREIEPHCRGMKAIYSPHTGITDWAVFTKFCAKDFQKRGGLVFCNFEVDEIREVIEGTDKVDVTTCPAEFSDSRKKQKVRSKYGIACGGLYSDRLARLASGLEEPVIVAFRGEYLELNDDKCHLVRGNIYPVPDPSLPFLGVHFTPKLDGRVLLGPNAVLALSREGYSWRDINVKDLWETITFPGFQSLMKLYGNYGYDELIKSFFISKRVKDLQKYIPDITAKDVTFRGFTGVRAQALDCNGILVDDLIMQLGTEGLDVRIMHLRNAPSPAATSSLALSEYIAKSALVEFDV